MVANAGMCHLLTSSKITNKIAISNTNVWSEHKVKLLGINLESKLNFDYHLYTLLNKANKKYHALARICSYMNTNKRRVLMKAFKTSQFSYCPLVWMFHSRTVNNGINILHEKTWRLIYTNKPDLCFDDLLKEDQSVIIHQKNLQILATETYKVKNDFGPKLMADIFHFVEKPYNLRHNSIIQKQANRSLFWDGKIIFSYSKNYGN